MEPAQAQELLAATADPAGLPMLIPAVLVFLVAVSGGHFLANVLRKRHGIDPRRSANLMDTISCSFPYMLPYAATIVAADGIQRELAAHYEFVQVVPWAQEVVFIFYGMVVFPLMIIAVLTGFGREWG